ncbi:MAG TPA: tetratricopeptide repeat protein [Candidatus Angelobacter sp.]|jgi:tetratricopeptide (TPR) repeat protein|nr:tetratricopeptide repeat protein [Candidatus Angelobacter sp.]
MLKRINLTFRRFVVAQVTILFFSAVYLYAFPAPTLFYAGVVLVHAGTGLIAALCLLRFCFRYLKGLTLSHKLGWLLLTLGALIGVALIYLGTTRPEIKWMYLHIALSVVALILLAANGIANYISPTIANRSLRRAGFVVFSLMAVALAYSSWSLRDGRWKSSHVIKNPSIAPLAMDNEGDGPKGPFFPSSAQVVSGGHIPSKFFMESDSCKRCHADIYNQWSSSVHHFSSFNNQWYRKSIEYMQEVAGTQPSKWCGGCHDPAVLYSGLMDTPIKQIVHRPEAQAGLGCMMCHSIVQVKSTMGQGDFYLEYPKMHELAASKNPVVRAVHDFLTYLNPEPHRRAFIKPFMRTQTAEFCSSCHKVHLDVPVNNYRWFRGFNEYDNWQASGVSGFGARSFYYPPKSQQCADCHMPLQHSQDAGNIAGMIHSHRFPAANTAVPVVNQDSEQLKITQDFLKNKAVSVDIFAITPARPITKNASMAQTDFATTFGVGEEAETKIAAGGGEALPVTAPLNHVQAVVRRGDTVRVDVVARTRSVGHFFPGGTVDAYDTWLELKATDDRGQTIFWSGQVEDEGKGPVEKGAHFYRALQVDAHGHPINKRNAWASRAVIYVRLIPPGAADTVHYRLAIPKNAGNTIKLHARMCYRKFAWWNTQFSFAGIPDPTQPNAEVTRSFDDRRMVFTGSTEDVSAKEKRIPDLPIVAMAEDEVTLQVIAEKAPAPAPRVDLQPKEWTRWNDYGIGLLLQGDLKNAQAAFEKITQIDPKNPDGWVNIGRAAIQEGDMERARTVLKQALALKPDLARANFFYAKVLRNDGDYDGALAHLRMVISQYPKDRVALNDLGRVLFLKRQYQDAIQQLKAVLAIDPEDLQANYNLMLCYNGVGDGKQAHEYELRYLRFKADEAAQALTGSYRILNPEDNQERQAIHEHGSARPAVGVASIGAGRQKPANKQNVAVQNRNKKVAAHFEKDSGAMSR